MTQFSIHVLQPEDQDAFYGLRHEALSQSAHSFGNHLSLWEAASQEQIHAMLEASASDEDGCILGAFQGRELLGMLGLIREKKVNVQHKATLWGFYVKPQGRDQGLGKALVQEMIQIATTYAGLNHLRLIVTDCDLAAQAVFKAAGFVEYGREERGLCSKGQFFDQIYMLRSLSA